MKKIVVIAAVLAGVAFVGEGFVCTVAAESVRGMRDNQAGGVTAGSARSIDTEQGSAASEKAVVTDGQGNAAGEKAKVWKGKNSTGAKTSATVKKSDGSVQHKRGMKVEGTQGGSATSTGSVTKDASGNISGERNTEATSKSGSTYQGETTGDSTSGITHTGKCFDPAGKEMPCPSK